MAHYFNWYKLGDCASIRSDGFWNNRSCGNELPYVCGKFPMWDLDESQLSWSNANNSCDGETLAILHNANENGNVTGVLKGNEAWIGLSKDSQNWLWVDQTLLTYSNWFTNFLCATMDCEGFWHDTSCFEKNPFVCIGQINSNLTYELFSESKTWKEAQSHCEMGNMKLAMLKTEEDITPLLAQICKTDMDNVQSVYVWTGLRFLAGSWFWVYGDGLQYENWIGGEQPQCPDVTRRCGALAVATGKWEPRSCEEKLEFLCFQK
ncbi:putative C-type mannose receptor 2-like [Triplophysa rosa]|uniref:C-type mannose receptor 2-like n=1 Tax=Triplophysa rosa TaxID=992332 RepID=A0A9W7TE02_TRIRA|nr:putative C-type mannose receptor 2-like [Triplophysa rosa]